MLRTQICDINLCAGFNANYMLGPLYTNSKAGRRDLVSARQTCFLRNLSEGRRNGIESRTGEDYK